MSYGPIFRSKKIPRWVINIGCRLLFIKKRMAKTIDEHLESSLDTKLVSAPVAPTRATWSWAAPGSELGDVNFQQVVLSSPRLIEHAARTCSKGVCGARHPSQSIEDYLLMISPHLPSLPEESVEKYLEKYIAVRYNNVRLTKRQYTAWLKHFLAVLHALDAEAPKSVEMLESNSSSLGVSDKPRTKRKKAAKSTL